MAKTAIEWTDYVWNPVRGCTHVSEGCRNCYAAALAYRYSAPGLAYEGLAAKGADGVPRFTGEVRLVPHLLDKPLRWREPRKVFVNSMSDAFHVAVPRDYLDQMFGVMFLAGRHTFQILTKRPTRAVRYLNDPATPSRIMGAIDRCGLDPEYARRCIRAIPWPLPNVWLGTSVETDRERHRIAALVRAPAAIHFLSCEPLLGPLDLAGGWLHHIEWVIVGGESGPRYRPLDLDWARAIRDQCVRAGVPFLFKQIGGYTPKAGGRELDGRTWDEYPTVIGAAAVSRDE